MELPDIVKRLVIAYGLRPYDINKGNLPPVLLQ